MIYVQTKLKCADNSGAKLLRCIRVLGNFKKRKAKVGDLVLVTVIRLDQKKKIKKKSMHLGLIISTKTKIRRLDGSFISSKHNRSLLFSDSGKFLGTRVYGYLTKEIRSNARNVEKYKKIISYSRATF